jgi:hypothetical protein
MIHARGIRPSRSLSVYCWDIVAGPTSFQREACRATVLLLRVYQIMKWLSKVLFEAVQVIGKPTILKTHMENK